MWICLCIGILSFDYWNLYDGDFLLYHHCYCQSTPINETCQDRVLRLCPCFCSAWILRSVYFQCAARNHYLCQAYPYNVVSGSILNFQNNNVAVLNITAAAQGRTSREETFSSHFITYTKCRAQTGHCWSITFQLKWLYLEYCVVSNDCCHCL